MRKQFARLAVVALVLVLGLATASQAQRNIKAEVVPVVATDGVAAGSELRTALQITLPEGLHTNSNKPRDPSLIPISVTVTSPPGIEVKEIVYPAPTDLVSKGSEQPLRVFERSFAIGVAMTVDADTPAGDLTIPVLLKYQACDEAMCYIPQRVATGWTVQVRGEKTAVAPAHEDVFKTIAWGTGEKPADVPATAAVAPAGTPSQVGSGKADKGDPLARVGEFAVLGSTGGYLGSSEFLDFVKGAESGVQQKGMFEGRGPLMILLLVFIGGLALNLTPCVLPMIPINLAIIGAGARAGSRGRGFWLGAAYGAAMRAAKDAGSLLPPKHILNAPTKMMREEGYGEGYQYDHDAPAAFSGQDYWPESLGRQSLYRPVERVFRRLARGAESSKSPEDARRRNNQVALQICGGAMLFIIPALLAWRYTPSLVALGIAVWIAYIWLYSRLARWRAPAWLVTAPRRTE